MKRKRGSERPPRAPPPSSDLLRLRAQFSQLSAQFAQMQRDYEARYAVVVAESWRHRSCNINSEAPTPLVTNPLELDIARQRRADAALDPDAAH